MKAQTLPGLKFASSVKAGGSVWAVADQGLVSLGSFLTNLLLARALVPAEYGVYALLYGVTMFMYTAHGAVVTYPLSVLGSKADHATFRRMAGFAVRLSVLATPLLGLVMLLACLLLRRPELVLWATVSTVAFLVQEATRRGLLSQLKHRQALLGDAVSYLGQAACIAALLVAGLRDLNWIFAAVTLTSLAGAGIQAWQIRPLTMSQAERGTSLPTFWNLGRWALLSSIVSVPTVLAFAWVLGATQSPASAASYQAITNLLGVSHPVMFGVGNIVISSVARAQADGRAAVVRAARPLVLQGAVLLAPYYLVLLLLPGVALGVLYGRNSPYLQYTSELRILVLVYMVSYVALMIGAILNGLEKSRLVFQSQMAGAVAAVVVGLPLAAVAGVSGAMLGRGVVEAVRSFSSYRILLRVWSKSNREDW